MPATFIAKTNGEEQYFTVLPMWELIYIQPWGCNPDIQPWGCSPDFQLLIEDMPFSAMRKGFRGVRHLAIDFDPPWTAEGLRASESFAGGDELEGDENERDLRHWVMYGALLNAVTDVEHLGKTTMWLVDHRLRRRNPPVLQKWQHEHLSTYPDYDQPVFHSTACTYSAVSEKFPDSFWAYNQQVENCVWAFLVELERVGKRRVALQEGIGEDEVVLQTFRVLACEQDQ